MSLLSNVTFCGHLIHHRSSNASNLCYILENKTVIEIAIKLKWHADPYHWINIHTSMHFVVRVNQILFKRVIMIDIKSWAFSAAFMLVKWLSHVFRLILENGKWKVSKLLKTITVRASFRRSLVGHEWWKQFNWDEFPGTWRKQCNKIWEFESSNSMYTAWKMMLWYTLWKVSDVHALLLKKNCIELLLLVHQSDIVLHSPNVNLNLNVEMFVSLNVNI